MTTTLDIAALVEAIALPAVILVALVWFREPLAGVLKEVAKRAESISLGVISVKLAAATPGALVGPAARVDLRKAGTPQDVSDSTLDSFSQQIADPARIDYAVVDLEDGSAWLSSRLYILSIILRRMRGLRAVVFVATVGTTRRRFIGVCSSEAIRWRLSARWPRLESALAVAELQVWGHPYRQARAPTTITLPVIPPPGDQEPQIPALSANVRVVNDEGRIEGSAPSPAVVLLGKFLAAIQREPPKAPRRSRGGPASQPSTDPDWVDLPGAVPPRTEYATWLQPELLETLLSGALDQRSIRLADLQGWSDELRSRAILEHSGDWIAITRDDLVFDHLIDRRQSLELALGPSSL